MATVSSSLIPASSFTADCLQVSEVCGSGEPGAAEAKTNEVGAAADRLTPWLMQTIDASTVMLWLSTALLAGLLGGQWVWLSTQRPSPLLLTRGGQSAGFQLDINTATWVEWVQLEGIGPSLANRIVADRRLRGPFRSLQDLQRVSGIGPETLHRLRSSIIIRHEHTIAESAVPNR